MQAKDKNTYDAIVVGSGMSGGWAAKELCERGLKTLVLERGRNVEHVTDYPTALKEPWELPHGNELTQRDEEEYAIQKQLWIVKQDTKHFFVKDAEHPYNQVKSFNWFRGYHVGGKSLMWSRHCFRLSDIDFEANAREGIGADWPIRYRDIAPWYDRVEEFIGVSGENAGLAHLPDGKLLPPLEMNCLERHVRERFEKRFADRRMIVARVAVLTRPHNGRGACQSRNLCARGCPHGAYFSSNSSTLPAAAATGKMTLRPFSIVHSVIYDPAKRRAAGVRVIDAETRETHEYFARIVFLNAGTLNSTAIMLNSTSPAFPAGLANSSGLLGHYLMDHQEAGAAMGYWDGDADKYYVGRKPNGMYVPRFRNLKEKRSDYVRGFAYECYSGREGWQRGSGTPGMGAAFKTEMTKPGRWWMYVVGYGEGLPERTNTVKLNTDKRDRWGLPTLDVDMQWGPNEHAMRKDMEASAVELLEAAGLKDVTAVPTNPVPGGTIHEMGTARMGVDPKASVLNRYNQCHDVPNLFVTDGSGMVSTGCQNPSLTYMALTARACERAVAEMKKGNL